MLITKGRVAPSEPWNILEVACGQAPDILAIRLSKEIKRVHDAAIQALIPMRRNTDGEAEWIVEHVYVRGANGSLGRLARTPGIDFIRKETAAPSWIQELMGYERKDEPPTLAMGSFVRILTGPCARLCGHITASPSFVVTVQMRTKNIRVHTCLPNLQLIDCPSEQQVFFYQSSLFA